MGFKVVIYYAASPGDVITAIPVAKQFQRTHENCEVTWICKQDTHELFSFFEPTITPVTPQKTALLNAEHFDLAIDLTGSRRGKACLMRVSASRRITPGRHLDHGRGKAGKHKRRPSPWAAKCRRRTDGAFERIDMPTTPHISHRLQGLVARALRVKHHPICASECVRPQYRWVPPPPGRGTLYCYHDSKHRHKLWPAAHIEALGTLAQANGLGQPHVLIDKAKHCPASEIPKRNVQIKLIERSWSFQVGWIRNAAVVIGPDTAPVHLAAALGAPTVALFGPTPSLRCGALGPRVENMQHSTCVFSPSLQPCWHRIVTTRLDLVHVNPFGRRFLHCRRPQCMLALRPNTVFQCACALLRRY